MYVERLNQPVTVTSIYDRVSSNPQFSVVRSDRTDPTRNDFLVSDETRLVAVLNNDLDTRTAHDYDRFTLTVIEPTPLVAAAKVLINKLCVQPDERTI